MEIPVDVLKEASARFGFEPDSLRFLGGMDGVVYETEADGKPLVLKLEPITPDRLAAVREKFEFITYLSQHGVRSVAPLPSAQGNLVEVITTRKGLFAATSSLKAPGRHVGAEDQEAWTPALFRAWGGVMGQMHRLAREYPYWRRPTADRTALDLDTEIQDWRMEHASFAQTCPDGEVRQRWLKLGETLQTLPVERGGFGLIHNDLHPWNFLYDQSSITVIDFDVCCYHWFITDIAIAVFHACWGEMAERPDNCQAFAHSFLNEFLTGYLRENPLSRDWLSCLPLFIHYREMLLFTALSNSWPSPRKDWQSRMVDALYRQCLDETQSLAALFGEEL